MHAVQGEKKRGRGGKTVEEWERSYNTNHFFPFSFHTFPLSHVSHVFPPLFLSPFVHSPFSLPLSPQRNPVSPLGLKLFEGDPELYCSLPLLSSLSSLPPALHPLTSLYPPLPPLSPQGAWILLNREQPCSKSRPGLSAPAAGLAGCPTAPQRDGEVGGLGGEERGEGGRWTDRGRNMRGAGCFWSHA